LAQAATAARSNSVMRNSSAMLRSQASTRGQLLANISPQRLQASQDWRLAYDGVLLRSAGTYQVRQPIRSRTVDKHPGPWFESSLDHHPKILGLIFHRFLPELPNRHTAVWQFCSCCGLFDLDC
jgi:hypothetical protein